MSVGSSVNEFLDKIGALSPGNDDDDDDTDDDADVSSEEEGGGELTGLLRCGRRLETPALDLRQGEAGHIAGPEGERQALSGRAVFAETG